jgi:hypothetical protein
MTDRHNVLQRYGTGRSIPVESLVLITQFSENATFSLIAEIIVYKKYPNGRNRRAQDRAIMQANECHRDAR